MRDGWLTKWTNWLNCDLKEKYNQLQFLRTLDKLKHLKAFWTLKCLKWVNPELKITLEALKWTKNDFDDWVLN